ncbi:DUF2690 domain-containing protein [Nocardia xishanensis]
MSEHEASEADRASDSVAAFAADLKALKQQHPKVSYEMMERHLRRRRIEVGRSTLNNAIKPNSLATERTVRAFVLALTDDEAAAARWVARRNRLAPPEKSENLAGHPPAPQRRAVSSNRLWQMATAVVVLVATNLATAVGVRSCGQDPVAEQTVRPTDSLPLVQTGADPGRTHCRFDAKVVAGNNAKPQMLLEILFSHTCDAAWARITRYDNAGLGNRLEVSIYRRSDPHGPTRQDAVEPDVDSAYTTLIVRVDPTDRLCATGAVATGAQVEHVSQEICT